MDDEPALRGDRAGTGSAPSQAAAWPARRRAVWLVRSRLGAAKVALAHALFERGEIDTSGRVFLDELGLDAPDRGEYAASSWLAQRRLMRGLTVSPGDVFIDFGCGKGRVVCAMALRYPFARVIGVDIAPELVSVARANADRIRERMRSREIELVTSDIRDYEVPDDVTFAYFYNPFFGTTFRAVLDALIASLDRHPRLLRILYLHPKLHDEVVATGRFALVRASKGLRRHRAHQVAHVYESLPPRVSARPVSPGPARGARGTS